MVVSCHESLPSSSSITAVVPPVVVVVTTSKDSKVVRTPLLLSLQEREHHYYHALFHKRCLILSAFPWERIVGVGMDSPPIPSCGTASRR